MYPVPPVTKTRLAVTPLFPIAYAMYDQRALVD